MRGVDTDDLEVGRCRQPRLGSLGLLDGLVVEVAPHVDQLTEALEVRRLECLVTGHVDQLVAPDRQWELAHVFGRLGLDLGLVQVILDVAILRRGERNAEPLVERRPEGEYAHERCPDVAEVQHVLRPAGRVDEDDAGCRDQVGVTVLAQLVDDVEGQQSTHGAADDHELVVVLVALQVLCDEVGHGVRVELISRVGDGQYVAVLQPGLDERLGRILTVGDQPGQVDDKRLVVLALVRMQVDLRGVVRLGPVDVGQQDENPEYHRDQDEQNCENPQPPGHADHLFPCGQADHLITSIRVV